MSSPVNNQSVGQTPPPSVLQPIQQQGGSHMSHSLGFAASAEPVPPTAESRPATQLPVEEVLTCTAEDITGMINAATAATREAIANNPMTHAAVSTASQGQAVILHHPEESFASMPPPVPTQASLMEQLDDLANEVQIFRESLPHVAQPRVWLEPILDAPPNAPPIAQPSAPIEPIAPAVAPSKPGKKESTLDQLAREKAEEKFLTDERYKPYLEKEAKELQEKGHSNIRQTMIREMLPAVKEEIQEKQLKDIARANPHSIALLKLQIDLNNFDNLSKYDQVVVVKEAIKLLAHCATQKRDSFVNPSDDSLKKLSDLENLMRKNPNIQKVINSTKETRVGYLQTLLQIRYSRPVEKAHDIAEFMSKYGQQLTEMRSEVSQNQVNIIQATPTMNAENLLKQLGIKANNDKVEEVAAQLRDAPEIVIFLQEGAVQYNTQTFLNQLSTIPAKAHAFLENALRDPSQLIKNQVKKYESIIKEHNKSIKENSARMKTIYDKIKKDPEHASDATNIQTFLTAPNEIARSIALEKLQSSKNPQISHLANELKARIDGKSKYSKYLNEIKEGFENKDYTRIAEHVIQIEKEQMRFTEHTGTKECLVETVQRYLNGKSQQFPEGSPQRQIIDNYISALKASESLDIQILSKLLEAMKPPPPPKNERMG